MNFAYRDNDFFKKGLEYEFQTNDGRTFISEVHLHKGNWYTNKSLNYKCTSVKSRNVNDVNPKNHE